MSSLSSQSAQALSDSLKADWKADLKLAIGPLIKKSLSLTKGGLSHKKLFRDPQTQVQITLTGAQGGKLAARFYRPVGQQPAPAVLLLHGSTPEGQQMGLYRLLGHKLAGLGYAVLTIDQRGHGQSDDPQKLTHKDDLDFAADAFLALEYLKQRTEVDAAQTYLLGHSFGGDVAITAGARAIGVNKILAYGPGRRYAERVQTELAYFCRRFTRYMGLSEMISPQLYLETIGAQLLENHQTHYQSAGHVPLMLIDGEYESQADRTFLEQISATLAEPVIYKTIPKADHYANVAAFGRVILYDQAAFDTLLTEIAGWFKVE